MLFRSHYPEDLARLGGQAQVLHPVADPASVEGVVHRETDVQVAYFEQRHLCLPLGGPGIYQGRQGLAETVYQQHQGQQGEPREQRQPPLARVQVTHGLGEDHADGGQLLGDPETEEGQPGFVRVNLT